MGGSLGLLLSSSWSSLGEDEGWFECVSFVCLICCDVLSFWCVSFVYFNLFRVQLLVYLCLF